MRLHCLRAADVEAAAMATSPVGRLFHWATGFFYIDCQGFENALGRSTPLWLTKCAFRKWRSLGL